MAAFGIPELMTSWGRVTRRRAARARPAFLDEVASLIGQARDATLLGIGLGRSYGDSGLNAGGNVIDMTALDQVIAFDPKTGIIRAEAGLTLSALLRIAVPRGWFLPTTPGTRFVTLGGAVANDVHGKNHRTAGTIGVSIRRIGLHRSDVGAIELSPDTNPEIFRATIGGLGLTGLIAWVELRLVPIGSAYLDVETIPFTGYDAFMALARASTPGFEHTVAWIDCTSSRDGRATRGLFSRANWLDDGDLAAHDDRTRAALPLELPAMAINPISLKAFNALYYAAGSRKQGQHRTHYAPFFYPLDAIQNWNRAYGSKGFYQYQCVVPYAAADLAIPALLGEIARSGQGSCLAVLKTFGAKASPGMLSFPREGVTLALDFPNRQTRTIELFDRLDSVVAEAQGRLYPAKDGRMRATMFCKGFPLLDAFSQHVDPRFQSDFWRRMSQ